MNKRNSKRIIAGYKTEIKYDDTVYMGVVENLSENGVNVLTDPIGNSIDFRPGETIDLKIESPAGESLNLICLIKWSDRELPHNIRIRIGLEIIDPPWNKTEYFL